MRGSLARAAVAVGVDALFFEVHRGLAETGVVGVLLRRLADRLAAGMRGLLGVTDVESSAEGGTPELQVRFEAARVQGNGVFEVLDRAERLGVVLP